MRVRGGNIGFRARPRTASWLAAVAPLFVLIQAARGQADDPGDSSKVLELTSFAGFTTMPYLSGPMDVDHPRDGSGRVFVSTNEGKIFGFASDGESLGILLDVGAPGVLPDFDDSLRFSTNGLTYIAFHPDFGAEGTPGARRLYTLYQSTTPGARDPDYSGATLATRPGDVLSQYVVCEWQVDANDPDRVDPTTRREVIRLEFSGPASTGHTACSIEFSPFARPGDPDYGLLFIPTGDMNNAGGVPNWQHVQDRDNPFGKVLRIDPLPAAGDPYSVPAGNPFADGGALHDDDGNTEEIFAWGFRNPQNASFAQDRSGATRLVVFDIGADDYEEVNLVDAADNHGWTRHDGPADGNPETALHLPAGSSLAFPAAAYDHEIPNVPGAEPTVEPTAISGGYVVSDPDDPGFRHQLLFADLPRGAFLHADFGEIAVADTRRAQARTWVMAVSLDGSPPGAFRDLTGWERGDARFGVDESGRVFVVSRWVDTLFLTNMVASQRSRCVPDWNDDGAVNTLDFLAYLGDWAAERPAADLTLDGRVNTLDFLAYLNAYVEAC